VPHYLGVTQNPRVADGLLRSVDSLFGLHLDFGDLERAVKRFEAQINAIIATNPEAEAYVRELERRADASLEEEENSADSLEPPSEALIKELEDFLRRRREQEGQ
jgi:hypothetical protein